MCVFVFVFFFKQKTAYELRISDWSSDVCSSDLYTRLVQALCEENGVDLIMVDSGKELGEWCGLVKYDADGSARKAVRTSCAVVTDFGEETAALNAEIGSASCRERVCQYV